MRHHGDKTDAMFWGWHAPWSTEDAILWSMADDYGWRTRAKAQIDHRTMPLEVTALPGVGHEPQYKARGLVLAALHRLLRARGSDVS